MLRFEVLGPVRAWQDDTEIDLGSPQQRAVLAILLLQHGTPASPDQLISAVWGPNAPRAAIGMVRSYVSRLRRVLPDAVIESLGGGYALRTGHLDLAEVQRLLGAAREAGGDHEAVATALRQALDRWHGTPLAGVNGEYAEAERVRLARLRLTAREDLAAADIAAGRHVEAATELADLVVEQPLRERPRELLMLALYRSGRQADALDVFAEGRHLLADELGLEPGPDLREMQRRILASDPALRPAVRPAATRPSQLPPDLPEFVGRHAERARIAAALTPTGATVPVVGLDGPPGVGKTALAVHAGHASAADFPDGQLFVDLAASTEPLAELLRGVGVDTLPESVSEQRALWRSVTAGRRLLVVLDGARDDDQVRSLLPGAGGAAVVVIARRRLFGLAQAHWLTLAGLTETESVALLERLIGVDRARAEPDVVRGMVGHTAGLPQVLTAVATRVAIRPRWTIAEAVRRLGPDPDAPVRAPECVAIEAPFESLLAELSAPQARAFRLLSLADGPDITLAAAAALLDLPLAATAALLESLVDVHLLEPGGPDRYSYHPPLRTFARGRAQTDDGPAATQQALTRLVRFYSTEDRLPSGA